MGIRTSEGFTIIETMLFLAISGVLVVAMIAGAGASLNVQRYRDATETFKNLIQRQYADLQNVQNDYDGQWSCNASAETETGGTALKGQSDCIMLGKYVTIEQGDISIYRVLGYQLNDRVVANEINSLATDYYLNVSTVDVEERRMEWQTTIAWAETGNDANTDQTPRSIALLFLRSPATGSTYTFSSDTVPSADALGRDTLNSMLVAGDSRPGQAARTICVASGGLAVGGDRGIYIRAFAAGASAVEMQSNDLDGGASQC